MQRVHIDVFSGVHWDLLGAGLRVSMEGSLWSISSCPSVLVLLHKIFNFAFSCTLRKVDMMTKNCHQIWEKFCHLDIFFISKYIIEVFDDNNFSKNDFELHSRLHEWKFYMKIQIWSPNAFTCVHDKLNIGSSCLLTLIGMRGDTFISFTIIHIQFFCQIWCAYLVA